MLTGDSLSLTRPHSLSFILLIIFFNGFQVFLAGNDCLKRYIGLELTLI